MRKALLEEIHIFLYEFMHFDSSSNTNHNFPFLGSFHLTYVKKLELIFSRDLRSIWSKTKWNWAFNSSKNPNIRDILSYDLTAPTPYELEPSSRYFSSLYFKELWKK